jgi:multicomponent K+:H+ antiporter subunit F
MNTGSLLYWATIVALLCLVLAMVFAALRMFIGPSAQDRVLALDALYICAMLVMLVLGIRYASEMFFEAALLIALFGFVGSATMAKFLLRGEVIE